jgi:hypothetical protein
MGGGRGEKNLMNTLENQDDKFSNYRFQNFKRVIIKLSIEISLL